jgi:hypothetical protein
MAVKPDRTISEKLLKHGRLMIGSAFTPLSPNIASTVLRCFAYLLRMRITCAAHRWTRPSLRDLMSELQEEEKHRAEIEHQRDCERDCDPPTIAPCRDVRACDVYNNSPLCYRCSIVDFPSSSSLLLSCSSKLCYCFLAYYARCSSPALRLQYYFLAHHRHDRFNSHRRGLAAFVLTIVIAALLLVNEIVAVSTSLACVSGTVSFGFVNPGNGYEYIFIPRTGMTTTDRMLCIIQRRGANRRMLVNIPKLRSFSVGHTKPAALVRVHYKTPIPQ